MPECDLRISDEFVARLANHLRPVLELRYAAGRRLSDSSAASGDPGEEDADVQPDSSDATRQMVRQWLERYHQA